MGLISKILGTDGVVEKAADGIYNGIDAAVFTQEEKSSYFLRLLKAYEPFKIAQRLLAIIIAVPYVTVYLVAAIMYGAGAFVEGDALSDAASKLKDMNRETLGPSFNIVGGFYFGGGAVEGIVRAATEKVK